MRVVVEMRVEKMLHGTCHLRLGMRFRGEALLCVETVESIPTPIRRCAVLCPAAIVACSRTSTCLIFASIQSVSHSSFKKASSGCSSPFHTAAMEEAESLSTAQLTGSSLRHSQRAS